MPADPLVLDVDADVARPRRRRRSTASDAPVVDNLQAFVDGVPSPQTIELQGMVRTSAGIPRGVAYSRWRTYTRATNEHDHDAKLRVGFPKGILALMQEAADNYPGYRNAADVVRDAVVHNLWWLAENHDNLVGLRGIDDWAVQMAVEQEHERALQRAKNVEQARDVLGKIEQMDDWSTYARVVEQYEGYAAGLDEPWGSKMQAVVEDGKAKLAKSAGLNT